MNVETLLLCFDDAWRGQWESLADATAGLTEAESAWQPPAYAREPHDEGVGRPGSILWHLNHLELCHRHYLELLQQRDAGTNPDTQPAGELSLDAATTALEQATQALREEIAQLGDDELGAKIREQSSIASFVAMIVRHMTWHAAQIKQTRRLQA